MGDGKGVCLHIAPCIPISHESPFLFTRKQGVQVYNERELSEYSLPHRRPGKGSIGSQNIFNQKTQSSECVCCRFEASSKNVCDKDVPLRL